MTASHRLLLFLQDVSLNQLGILTQFTAECITQCNNSQLKIGHCVHVSSLNPVPQRKQKSVCEVNPQTPKSFLLQRRQLQLGCAPLLLCLGIPHLYGDMGDVKHPNACIAATVFTFKTTTTKQTVFSPQYLFFPSFIINMAKILLWQNTTLTRNTKAQAIF